MSQAVDAYICANEARFLDELKDFIRIPSISTLPEHEGDVRRAAQFVAGFARHLGIPTILMGLGLPDNGLHSPNEKFKVANYYLGILAVTHFLGEYGAA